MNKKQVLPNLDILIYGPPFTEKIAYTYISRVTLRQTKKQKLTLV